MDAPSDYDRWAEAKQDEIENLRADIERLEEINADAIIRLDKRAGWLEELRVEVVQLRIDNDRLRMGMDPTAVTALSKLDRQEKEGGGE